MTEQRDESGRDEHGSLGLCDRCGHELADDEGASHPYCPICEWCPDCDVTHPSRLPPLSILDGEMFPLET